MKTFKKCCPDPHPRKRRLSIEITKNRIRTRASRTQDRMRTEDSKEELLIMVVDSKEAGEEEKLTGARPMNESIIEYKYY